MDLSCSHNISTLDGKDISSCFPFLNFMQKFLSFPLLRSHNHLKEKSTRLLVHWLGHCSETWRSDVAVHLPARLKAS